MSKSIAPPTDGNERGTYMLLCRSNHEDQWRNAYPPMSLAEAIKCFENAMCIFGYNNLKVVCDVQVDIEVTATAPTKGDTE